MSQLSDIRETFKNFQHRYHWTNEETVDNFLKILADIEGSLVLKDPVGEDGYTDFEKLEQMEKEEAFRLFEY